MKKILFLLVALTLLSGCNDSNSIDLVTANAVIYEVSSEDQITFTAGDEIGTATFTYNQNFTLLEINLSGLEPNTEHAMHLHMGTLETPGMHWNQGLSSSFCNEMSQGVAWGKLMAGDIGNIEIDGNGDGYFRLSTDLWTLDKGKSSDIEGTVLFLHDQPEPFEANCGDARLSHANAKIAAGTVELSN